jgi:hypothetical protein
MVWQSGVALACNPPARGTGCHLPFSQPEKSVSLEEANTARNMSGEKMLRRKMHFCRTLLVIVAALFGLATASQATPSSDPLSITFGDVPINTQATTSVLINVDPAYSTEIASGSGLNPPFSFGFDTCGAGGGFSGPGTCSIQESFQPTSIGSASGSLNVFECPNAGGSCIPVTIPVSGNGVSIASADPTSLDFGGVPINTTASDPVTITVDTGYRTEIASGSGLNPPFSFGFGSCGTGGGFAGPGTCTIDESYTPTSVGANSGSTNVFECPVAGGTCIPIPVPLSGHGISVASADPTHVDFGGVPINTTVTVPVTIAVDTGYKTEIASGSGLNNPFSFGFDACGTGGGFAGPGTCTVDASFTPTSIGSFSGTTNVFECPIVGGTCIPISFTLGGQGISIASADPTLLDFGLVPIGTTASAPVDITVDTGYRTEIASGTGLNDPFSFAFDTCGIGGGFGGPGTCSVIESFTPTGLGIANATTNVFECPVVGGTCIPIPYSATGQGVTAAVPEPASLALFGAVLAVIVLMRKRRRV